MHSHDRTLLAKLGFSDPDKKDRRHDLACQYVAQKEVAERLAERLFAEEITLGETYLDILAAARNGNVEARSVLEGVAIAEHRRGVSAPEIAGFRPPVFQGASIEHHIVKGEGKYATTVGFADALLRFSAVMPSWERRGCPTHGEHLESRKWEQWRFGEANWMIDPVLVEVKIAPIETGAIIRQMRLYQRYIERRSAVVVLCLFPLSADDINSLGGAGISYVKLGAGFEDYCRRRESSPAPDHLPEI